MKTPNGKTLSTDEWKDRAHELVFEALDRAGKTVDYPADKGKVVQAGRDVKVLGEPGVTLEPFLETLPEREFSSKEDVARALNETWQKAGEAPTGITGQFP